MNHLSCVPQAGAGSCVPQDEANNSFVVIVSYLRVYSGFPVRRPHYSRGAERLQEGYFSIIR